MYYTICNILATELPISEQKKVILMILNAQHPHNLSIGGFEVLNVETFIFVSTENTCVLVVDFNINRPCLAPSMRKSPHELMLDYIN